MTKLSEILSKHGIDNAELVAELESAITTEQSGKTIDGVPYARFKEKVREYKELLAEKAEIEAKLEEVSNQYQESQKKIEELSQYETEYKNIQKQKFEEQLKKWNEYKSLLDIDESDKRFEKVAKIKDKFNLGDELSAEDVQRNLELFETFKEVGIFETVENPPNYHSKKPDGNPPEGEFYGFESPQELAWKNPELYEKWRKNNN